MIKYTYYGLLTAFAILLLIAVIYYFVKPVPAGDSSVGWATGIYYLAGLAGIMLVALLFWRNKPIGIAILCVPLLLAILPSITDKFTDLYAWLPTGKKESLNLHIVNNTKALVNVKLECWFEGAYENEFSLYKTLEFTAKPFEASQHLLSEYDTRLLTTKSGFVRIVLFECIQESGKGYTYVREIQPSMQNKQIPIEAFQNKNYILTIDGEKNSEAFLNEITRLKKDSMYTNGAF